MDGKLSDKEAQSLTDQLRQIRNDQDIILMRKVADGDAEAFERLYMRFYPVLKSSFADCTNHNTSSDDLIQEVFTRLWQQRGNFREESIFLTYLLGIARYVHNENLRKYRRVIETHYRRHQDLTTGSYHDLSQPEAELHFNELAAVLERIRSMLTSEQQQALQIFQAEDGSMASEARKLGCSYNALRCRLKRARKQLKLMLVSFLKDE